MRGWGRRRRQAILDKLRTEKKSANITGTKKAMNETHLSRDCRSRGETVRSSGVLKK